MARKKRNEVAVGITVLVVLVLTFFIVVTLADWRGVVTPKQEITVKLPYRVGLKGLQTGSPIHLGGFKIGQVTNTTIDKINSASSDDSDIYVYFTMKLPREYPVRTDCKLAPESNVLGGQTILRIDDLGRAGALVSDGETVELPLAESVTDAIKKEFDPDNPDGLIAQLKYEVDRDNSDSILASLARTAANMKEITGKINVQVTTTDDQKMTVMTRIHAIMDKVSCITENLNCQLDAGDDKAALAKLNSALDKLDSSLAQIKDMVQTSKPDVTDMFASLKNTAEHLEKDVPDITAQIKESLAKVDKSLDTAQVALENLKGFTEGANETIVVNRDNIDQIIQNFTEVSTNVKLAIRDIKRAPWKLLYKPQKDEVKIQGLIDSAGAFAAGAERLDSATLRLKRMVQTDEGALVIDREEINAMIAELETSFQRYRQAEDVFWEELD
ncbi:MAG: hypothetical protein JW860_13600 [Sedimentisphaerales bacterium]|nr:hypothetical protein [Sedimentisphaerales bacterium]